jgi:hypothetical protein
MPSLDTTNIILGIIAAAVAAQSILLVLLAVVVGRQVAQLRQTVHRFESTHLPGVARQVNALVEDLHHIAERVDRVGYEVERTTKIAQGILNVAGNEVERATRGVRTALDLVESGVRQAGRVGAGVRAGVQELFRRPQNHHERRVDEDAVARFEAGA